MTNLVLNLNWIDTDPFAAYKLKIQKVNREQLSEVELHGDSRYLFRCLLYRHVFDSFNGNSNLKTSIRMSKWRPFIISWIAGRNNDKTSISATTTTFIYNI